MVELLALRSCSCPLVSSYSRSSASIGGRQRAATALGAGCPQPSQVREVSIRRSNHQTLRLARVSRSSVRAGLGDANGNNEPSPSKGFTSQDWQYLGKVMVACTGVAIIIKYGSVLVPDITRPNLVQALIMITTPVLVSVAVLSAASSGQKSEL